MATGQNPLQRELPSTVSLSGPQDGPAVPISFSPAPPQALRLAWCALLCEGLPCPPRRALCAPRSSLKELTGRLGEAKMHCEVQKGFFPRAQACDLHRPKANKEPQVLDSQNSLAGACSLQRSQGNLVPARIWAEGAAGCPHTSLSTSVLPEVLESRPDKHNTRHFYSCNSCLPPSFTLFLGSGSIQQEWPTYCWRGLWHGTSLFFLTGGDSLQAEKFTGWGSQ